MIFIDKSLKFQKKKKTNKQTNSLKDFREEAKRKTCSRSLRKIGWIRLLF